VLLVVAAVLIAFSILSPLQRFSVNDFLSAVVKHVNKLVQMNRIFRVKNAISTDPVYVKFDGCKLKSHNVAIFAVHDILTVYILAHNL
jgi:hypothetical protein